MAVPKRRNPRLPQLLELFITLPDDTYQEGAAIELIALGDEAVDDLIQLCGSAEPRHRWRAVWTLGKIRSSRSYETIVKLTDDEVESVAYDATLALGHFGDERAIQFLRDLRQLRDHRAAPATEALWLLGENVRPLRKSRLS